MSRRRPLLLAAAVLHAVLHAVLGSACAVQTQGSFDDVPFAPGATAVAILDAHDVIERAGGLTPVERPDADKRVHLWLSGADLPEGDDWRHLADERLLDVKKDLARNDLLVLRDLPLERLADGDAVTANNDAGDFSFAIGQKSVGDDVVGEGLGSRVTVTVEPGRVEQEGPRFGTFEAVVTVERERGVGQPANDVATGTVTFTIGLGFAPERLAEANFAFVAPIAACAQARGPGAASGCDDVDREPIIDETGRH